MYIKIDAGRYDEPVYLEVDRIQSFGSNLVGIYESRSSVLPSLQLEMGHDWENSIAILSRQEWEDAQKEGKTIAVVSAAGYRHGSETAIYYRNHKRDQRLNIDNNDVPELIRHLQGVSTKETQC